ncbi:hypothetical protein [Mycolicibacterium mengxianglii]|uniref:hypothetical protein n=1 Tax=Mycolicibacterium mengxianglii TaxID=2736649 RepID=UPI0018D13621|nr:hypothetical protein [Mycolicibacterium mengxianglii]
MTLLSAGCVAVEDSSQVGPERLGVPENMCKNPYAFGAVGDGTHDDTAAFRKAYESAVNEGGGAVVLTRGHFFLPGNLEIEQPGVSLLSNGGAVIGGGEVRIGPSSYENRSGGVDFAGVEVRGIVFDRSDDYGSARSLVLRNVRGLDVTENVFRSAGKGLAVEGVDGNEKSHTTAMVRVAGNRFAKLAFGIFADTSEWDCLSDWQIIDNYFNYCSDTSVWMAATSGDKPGGVDGLNFAGNTIFSLNHNARADPRFAAKRYNLRLGQTNWLRITSNNFFEAGLSAVYLDTPQHFTFVGNHVAWPGQRERGDAIEIRNGSPRGVIEANTFAEWTRAAVGLYDLSDLNHIEIGQNLWQWTPSPESWTGEGDLVGYRVFANEGGSGRPIIRDFQATGVYDELKGKAQLQARDIKSSRGGVTGAARRDVSVSSRVSIFTISDIANSPNFGGLISVTVTNAVDEALGATYLLFVSSQGSVCTVIEAGGYIEGTDVRHPSFAWSLSGRDLIVEPVGSANDTYNFDAVGIGAICPS